MGGGLTVGREKEMPLKALKYFLVLVQQRVLPKTLEKKSSLQKMGFWNEEITAFLKPIVIKNLP